MNADFWIPGGYAEAKLDEFSAGYAEKHGVAKAHPFELSGLGVGPFRLVGVWSMPSPALAEANPSAYNAALESAPRNAGSCQHCGMGIFHHYIIADSTGKTFHVGSDCVMKTDRGSLADAVKVEVSRMRAQAARKLRARKEAERREAYEASPEFTALLRQQAAAAQQQEEARTQAIALCLNRFGFMLPLLDNLAGNGGNFAASIAREIRQGIEPAGRAVDILADIYGKADGARRGSNRYEARTAAFWKVVENN